MARANPPSIANDWVMRKPTRKLKPNSHDGDWPSIPAYSRLQTRPTAIANAAVSGR